jgi:hypothetical protein
VGTGVGDDDVDEFDFGVFGSGNDAADGFRHGLLSAVEPSILGRNSGAEV